MGLGFPICRVADAQRGQAASFILELWFSATKVFGVPRHLVFQGTWYSRVLGILGYLVF